MGDELDSEQPMERRAPGDEPVSATQETIDEQHRRSGSDRRGQIDRRRSVRGLFERRARRDGVIDDRRQGDRRDYPLLKLRWLFGQRKSSDSR